jgi:hypothetical protein
MPFMKLKTPTNVYYKVDKDFLKKPDNYTNYWQKWTELTGLGRKYQDIMSLVLEISFIEGVYCSFRILDNFEYDIKFAIGKNRRTTLDKIEKFCTTKLNDIIEELQKVYADAHVFIPLIVKQNITIVKINSVDTIALDKKSILYDKFPEVINTVMFPYFNIIPSHERNIMLLQYKKVDNYMKYDNITAFIMKRPTLSKENIIREVSKWFRISWDEAANEYERREGEIIMEMENKGGVKVFRPRTDGFLNIRISITSPVDMECEISGFKYFAMHDRIIELLKVLINLTNTPISIEGILDVKKIEKGLYDKTHNGALLKLKDVEKEDIREEEIEAEYMEDEEKGEEEDNDGYYYAPSTKPKKPRTEKQLEQLRQARVKALVNKEMKRKEKEKEEEAKRKIIEETKQEQKKALQQKIVKKALSIKKKEIKKQEVLDEISDDETPIEKIKIPKKKAETTPQKKNIIYFD